MSPTKIWLREVPYTVNCCGCDVEMHRGQQMVQTATLRLRGYQVRFCLACAEEVGKLTAYRPSGLAQPEQEDAKDAMISIGHQYLFASPFGGDVWRDNSNEWNGLRPKESREIYAVRGGAA